MIYFSLLTELEDPGQRTGTTSGFLLAPSSLPAGLPHAEGSLQVLPTWILLLQIPGKILPKLGIRAISGQTRLSSGPATLLDHRLAGGAH